jgi:kynurenine formamidase
MEFLNKKVIDLTLLLKPGESSWGNLHPPLVMIDYHQNWMNRGNYPADSPITGFSTKYIGLTDHTGTHMDAKRHFHPDGETMDMYDIGYFMGEALYLDLSNREWDEEVSPEHFEKALIRTGEEIKEGDIVVVKAWKNGRSHDRFGDSYLLNKESAWYLIDKKIKMFCTDLATVDYSDRYRNAHYFMLLQNILIVENLVNLERLSEGRFMFMALPLNIEGLTGSPVRALAFID